MQLIKLVIYLALILGIIYLLSQKRAPELNDPVKMVMAPGTYKSLPYDELRKLMPERFKYIKEKSTFLEPYDKDKLDLISDKITKVTGEQMIFMMMSAPNSGLGYYRLEPFEAPFDNAAVHTSFQFEQGMVGWFWIYGTFADSAGATASFMYYVFRIDTFPPELRKSMNLPLGATTYYYISSGVGRGSEWHYSPFKICRGEYNIKSDSAFSFTGIDLPDGWKSILKMDSAGEFSLESFWPEKNKPDTTNRKQGFNIHMSQQKASPAQRPCRLRSMHGRRRNYVFFIYTIKDRRNAHIE